VIDTGVSDAANLAGSWLFEKIASLRNREASMSLCFDRLTPEPSYFSSDGGVKPGNIRAVE